jgi:hypothetical protein
MRNEYNILVGKSEGRDHSGDLVVILRVILKCSLNE